MKNGQGRQVCLFDPALMSEADWRKQKFRRPRRAVLWWRLLT